MRKNTNIRLESSQKINLFYSQITEYSLEGVEKCENIASTYSKEPIKTDVTIIKRKRQLEKYVNHCKLQTR